MKSTHALLIGSCALMLFGAGCSQEAARPEAAAPAPAPAPTAAEVAAVPSSKCDNAYYPLKKGTKLTYATNVAGKSSEYTMEVTDGTDTSAKIQYTYSPKLQISSDITCTDEGLRATAFLDSGMAGGSVSAKTISASGTLIPQDLHTGSVWTSAYEVETDINIPNAARLGLSKGHMVVNTTSTALGEESVTVAAGTFTAMKVEAKMHSHMTLGARMPAVDTDVTTVSYFVKGKGLVKSETKDAKGNMSTMEAKEVIVP